MKRKERLLMGYMAVGGLGLLLLFLPFLDTKAKDSYQEVEQAFVEELNLEELDSTLEELKKQTGSSFSELVEQLARGDLSWSWECIRELIATALFGEWSRQKNIAVSVLLLMVGAAVFSNFAGLFDKSQVAEVSFYVIYLLLFSILVKAFSQMSTLAEEALEKLLVFMKLLMPSYFLASVFSSQSISGTAFYELILAVMTLIQWAIRYFLLPAVNFYFLFTLLNHISGEDYLSKMADLLKNSVEWVLKTLVGAVVGIQAIQSLILPAVDNLKNTVFQKSGGSLPVVGNIFNNVSEMVLGCALVIRNGVGTAGLFVVIFLCVSPGVQLIATAVLYRILAACTQPVADKRLTECLDGLGQGIVLLFKILAATALLFFLSLALSMAAR